jgi:hypothetical protein
VENVSPQGGRYTHNFVQCSKCGTPAGVIDLTNTSADIQKLGLALNGLSLQLHEIQRRLMALEHSVKV